MKSMLSISAFLILLFSCKKSDDGPRVELQFLDAFSRLPVPGLEVNKIVDCKKYSNIGFNASCLEPVYEVRVTDANGKARIAEGNSPVFSTYHPDYYDVSKTTSIIPGRQQFNLYPRAKANVNVQFSDQRGYQMSIFSDVPAWRQLEAGFASPGPYLFIGTNIQVQPKSGTGIIDLIAGTENELEIIYTNGNLEQTVKVVRVTPATGQLMEVNVTL
jgi:hypothetical protein